MCASDYPLEAELSPPESLPPQDAARILSLLQRVSRLPPNISDPAKHEKILSYFQFWAKRPEVAAWAVKCGALETAVEGIHHLDVRVISLACRISGALVQSDALTFTVIHNQHHKLLKFVLETLQYEQCPAALRFGMLETVRLYVTCDAGLSWFTGHETALSSLLQSLASPSIYVGNAATRLCVGILTRDLNIETLKLLQNNICAELTGWLTGEDAQKRLAALEVVWSLCQETSEIAWKARWRALRHSQLVPRCIAILTMNVDRITHSRVLDALKALFRQHGPELSVLLQETFSIQARPSEQYVYDQAFHALANMLRAETTLEPVLGDVLMQLGLVELLGLTAAKATHYQRLQTWLVTTVMGMISRNYGGPCSAHTDRELDEVTSKLFAILAQYLTLDGTSSHYKHTVLQALLTTLGNLHLGFEEGHDDGKEVFEEVIALMRHLLDTHNEDKVLLATLKCLATYVPWCDRENVDTLQSLFRVMSADSSPQVIKAALDIISTNYRGSRIIDAYALEFKDVLLNLLRGSRWEVRDTILEFTQQGILDGTSAGVSMAACVDLYCDDDEPWVRAAALRATAAVGSCSSTRMEEVIRKGLKDDCALVRRAAVEILSSDDVANQASKWGTSVIFVDVMADEDSEVRLRGAIVMRNWWCALRDSFWKFQMDDRTLEAAADSSRVVRSAVMEFLSKEILPLESVEPGRTVGFVSRVQSLDIDRLRNSADPDLVYGDGFELDFDGEGRQVGYVDEHGVEEEDVVCLGCYDC